MREEGGGSREKVVAAGAVSDFPYFVNHFCHLFFGVIFSCIIVDVTLPGGATRTWTGGDERVPLVADVSPVGWIMA
jgi:hypothetical protein